MLVHQRFVTIGAALALALCAAFPLQPARAGEIEVTTAMAPGLGEGRLHVTSLQEARYRDLIRQKTDFSCGAAAVATILRYAYGLPSTEETVLAGMLRVSDPALVRERGFSMLDMKRYVESLGIAGIGYRLNFTQLSMVRVPSILVLNVEGYEHFVVFKKILGAYVYIADPSQGNRRIPVEQFRRAWNGIMFTIASPSYHQQNALLAVDQPPSARGFMESLPPMIDPLSNLTLTAVGVLPTSRL